VAHLRIPVLVSSWAKVLKVDSMRSRFFHLLSFVVAACSLHSPTFQSHADTIRLMHGEVEAFQNRMELVRNAQSTIDAVYYEVADDFTSGHFLAALVEAAERGVQVRLLVDAHAGDSVLPQSLVERLIERGVCVRERPVDVRSKIEIGRQRIHDKLLIVDRTHLVMGGRNMGEGYFGNSNHNYVDRDLLLSGDFASQPAEYFESRWHDPKSGQPNLVRTEKKNSVQHQQHPEWDRMDRQVAKQHVDAWLAECQALTNPATDLCTGAFKLEAMELENCKLRFLHDFVGERKDVAGAIGPEVLRLIDHAKRSIDIETPYFAITKDLKSRLLAATNRGVRISILTNSLESTDQVAAHAGYANQRRWILRAGILLYELQGMNTLHAKSMVIDGHTAMVGSYNFDALSERRNSEVALIAHDSQFATDVLKSIEFHRRFCEKLERGELFRFEARESDASASKIQQLRRLRIAAPLIKRYL
jgi:cardiolipin synthase C